MILLISSFTWAAILSLVQTAFDFFASIGKDLLANAVGALIGAILAIPTGLWLDRQVKSKEQRERSKKILRAVFDELDRNQTALKGFLAKPPSEDEIDYPNLDNNAWQAAQNLEILSSSKDYELHKVLLDVYEKVSFMSQISQSLWNLFFSANYDFGVLERKVKTLMNTQKAEANNLLPLVEEALDKVQSRL